MNGPQAFLFIMLVFGGILAVVLYLHYYAKAKIERLRTAWALWAAEQGYQSNSQAAPMQLARSSFNTGKILASASGRLPEADNSFTVMLQEETRGHGRNRQTFRRTILSIDVPDIRLHMIINSKTNNDDRSGGNLGLYKNQQRYMLEGDFGVFYDLYMPDTTQSETLSMLTPDSMLYILKELVDFDIEINGGKLYVYAYHHLAATDVELLIQKSGAMLAEMRLRKQDSRQSNTDNALTARTVSGPATLHRGLKKTAGYGFVVLAIVYFAAQTVDHPLANVAVFLLFAYFIGQLVAEGARQRRLKRKYQEVIKHY